MQLKRLFISPAPPDILLAILRELNILYKIHCASDDLNSNTFTCSYTLCLPNIESTILYFILQFIFTLDNWIESLPSEYIRSWRIPVIYNKIWELVRDAQRKPRLFH